MVIVMHPVYSHIFYFSDRAACPGAVTPGTRENCCSVCFELQLEFGLKWMTSMNDLAFDLSLSLNRDCSLDIYNIIMIFLV